MRQEIKNKLIDHLQEIAGVEVRWWPLHKPSISHETFPVVMLFPDDDLFIEKNPDTTKPTQNNKEAIFRMKLQVVNTEGDGLEVMLQNIEEKLGQKEWDYDGWRFGQDGESEKPLVSAVTTVKKQYDKNFFENPGESGEVENNLFQEGDQ